MPTPQAAAVLVASFLLAGAAGAQAEEYHGRIHCDVLPRVADRGPLNEAFEATVSGATLTFHRNVLVSNTSIISGVEEQGTGTVTGDQVTMAGHAAGAKYSYTSAYQGTIKDGRITVTGAQIWNIRGWAYSPYSRACHIELSR